VPSLFTTVHCSRSGNKNNTLAAHLGQPNQIAASQPAAKNKDRSVAAAVFAIR
jgi:hypothetical protein